MRALLFIFLVLGPLALSAQKLRWESTTVNFGTVTDWNSPPAVFHFKNTGRSKLLFLPQKHGREELVRYPNKAILPGETGELTIHYYSGETGVFSHSVEVFTNASDRPEKLTVKGNIKSIYADALTACPTFHDAPVVRSSQPNVIQAVDAVTQRPIVNAQIEVYDRGIRKALNGTNLDGVAVNWIEPGKYVAVASKEGYEKLEQEVVFTKRERTQVVYLRRTEQEVEMNESEIANSVADRWGQAELQTEPERYHRTEAPETTMDLGVRTNDQFVKTNPSSSQRQQDLGITTNQVLATEIPISEPVKLDLGINANDQWAEAEVQSNEPALAETLIPDEKKMEDRIEAELVEDASPNPRTEPTEIEPITSEFSTESYRPNNVLLLIDVSGSMRDDGKMDKLKSAVRRLVLMLREVDVLTLIAYNSSSWEVLPPTPVKNNLAIVALVDSLEPEGYTNGVKGMEAAYTSLYAQLILGGNNQLIIATDGKFNSSKFSENEAIQLAKANADKGIDLSIIGFGEDKDATRLMRRLAREGNGNFIQIDSDVDPTELLAEEIKMRSRKR